MRAGTERIVAVAAALGLALASAAHAQPSAAGAATLQFDKGRALMKEKKYAEACAAFEQSQKLDPQLGTLYNLGVCYAQLGKIASAWNAYREVGQRDTNADRKREANRRARDLEKRLPRILLTIADPPPGLTVTMNGADVTAFLGAESPVDPAEYALKATAPGHAAWETTAEISAEGKTITIEIELEREARADPGPGTGSRRSGRREAREDRPESPPPGRPASPGRRRLAIGLALGGAGSLAAGLVLGNLARGKWDEAQALCGPDRICDDAGTLARGQALVDEARTRASFSTAFVIGGAAMAGIAAVVWLTAPKAKTSADQVVRIAPQLGPDHAALTIGGTFP